MRRSLLGLAAGLLLAYLLTGVTQVRPGERAVVRRFGAVVAQPGPGLHVGWPWGVDRVDRVPVGLLREVRVGLLAGEEPAPEPTPAGQLLTGDQNLVHVEVRVHYAVTDDEVVEFVLAAERVDAVVERLAEAALTEWAAGRTVDEVLLTGSAQLPIWLTQRMQERLPIYRLGVAVRTANVSLLQPPAEVKPAFDRVAQLQAAIRTSETHARQRAHRMLNEARIRQLQEERSALAYADERRKLARADAETFQNRLAQYRRLRQTNPDVLNAIWWDEMGKLLRRLHEAGRMELLDAYLGPDGLDITQFGPRPRKR